MKNFYPLLRNNNQIPADILSLILTYAENKFHEGS